ncbi:hypothetical protein [Azospirillum sp. B506]|uniref:hypothetical protein n=1 Tax=Azospirillum sp. B506 TaxID=137721 RepID=UPI00034BAC69|nr:hypothetical protein [Azospirillum sp. B506]
MSGVIKGVGKVFKRVGSGAAKILPVALAAGAVMFTAGNALGVTSSWGDAVKSVTDSLGMGSTLSNVISGAVTNAGYGAVAGGAMGAIAGGSMLAGAQYGAAAGAVLGGAKGAYDSYMGSDGATAPSATANGDTAASTGARVETAPPPSDAAQGARNGLLRINSASALSDGGGDSGGGAGSPTNVPRMSANAATGMIEKTTAARDALYGGAASSRPGTDIGGIFDKGGWLERNQGLVGNTVAGLGKGLLGGDGGAEAIKARAAVVRANYGGARTGLLTASSNSQATAGQQPGMTPQQRFSAAGVQGQYVYDPATGRYVLVPATV